MNCQHDGCGCMAPEGESFCSEYCREHGAEMHGEHMCECGHPECRAA